MLKELTEMYEQLVLQEDALYAQLNTYLQLETTLLDQVFDAQPAQWLAPIRHCLHFLAELKHVLHLQLIDV
ncbi:hypothetical protein [Cohnella soli]|uniref:Uncharacterized protein n=1 Tax=Cohnella soli TaxID=425005 RepID=A0ABW0HVM7_9BACL